MKLFLMRHATAENKENCSDFDRELTTQGEAQAIQAGKYIEKENIDNVLISPAARTKKTFELMNNSAKIDNYIFKEDIYLADEYNLLEMIKSQNGKNLLIIAHNPSIFSCSLLLSNIDDKEYDSLLTHGMKPSQIVEIDFPNLVNWSEIQEYSGTIKSIFISS